MASFIYRCFSGTILISLHVINFHLCNKFLRPTLLPLLFTTNDVRLVNSINLMLKELNLNDQIPLDKIKSLNILNDSKDRFNKYNNSLKNYISSFPILSFDLLISLSLQLVELFLIDILQVTDFQIRHFDWYLTLSILIISLAYLTPSFILYNLILSNQQNNILKKFINFVLILIFWFSFLFILYFFTVNKEVNGNFLQLSLYLLSLFGVSCLSILNGLGCVTGFYDSIDWYLGNEEINLKKKELELTYDLKTLDSLLISKESNLNDMIWNQLIKIDSILRDIALLKQNRKGIYRIFNFVFWTYCIYKTLYGIINSVKVVFNSIGIFQIVYENNNNNNKKGEMFSGNGDFLSNMIAKIILVYIYKDSKIRSFSTFDEIVDENQDILNRITMIVNFLISFIFFTFSFQNVLLTFKNFKKLSRKLVRLNEFDFFNKFKENLNELNEVKPIIKENLFNELTYLFVSEITGIYVVSTALLLNSKNMPIHLSQLLMNINDWNAQKSSSIKSYINADFMNAWFERWFAVGCIGTILVLVILDQVKSLTKSTSKFDEEGLV